MDFVDDSGWLKYSNRLRALELRADELNLELEATREENKQLKKELQENDEGETGINISFRNFKLYERSIFLSLAALAKYIYKLSNFHRIGKSSEFWIRNSEIGLGSAQGKFISAEENHNLKNTR